MGLQLVKGQSRVPGSVPPAAAGGLGGEGLIVYLLLGSPTTCVCVWLCDICRRQGSCICRQAANGAVPQYYRTTV